MLDVGLGPVDHVLPFAERRRVMGVNWKPEVLEPARRRLAETSKLPFERAEFDFV